MATQSFPLYTQPLCQGRCVAAVAAALSGFERRVGSRVGVGCIEDAVWVAGLPDCDLRITWSPRSKKPRSTPRVCCVVVQLLHRALQDECLEVYLLDAVCLRRLLELLSCPGMLTHVEYVEECEEQLSTLSTPPPTGLSTFEQTTMAASLLLAPVEQPPNGVSSSHSLTALRLAIGRAMISGSNGENRLARFLVRACSLCDHKTPPSPITGTHARCDSGGAISATSRRIPTQS